MEEIKLEIPRTLNDPNPINLHLKNRDILFIVGANGSGKSALMQQFASENQKSKLITAHRQTWFSTAKNNLTPDSRQGIETNRLNYTSNLSARWTDSFSERDWSAILFDLDAKENAIDKSIAQHVRNKDTSKAEKIADESPLPFDQMNELLSLGRLEVTLEKAEDQSILARRKQGQPFRVIEMSDGERNAMIIAGHVITAEAGTVFLIDEPDKHLHPAITQPFFSALFDLRRDDCAFIIATHDIGLPVTNPKAQFLMLRSCQWNGSRCVSWEAEVLEPNIQLPEELKYEILGSRKKILFVEGKSTGSLDTLLYTTLFPDISVIPKGSCEEVQKTVLGLRDSQDSHHVEAFGLIDRDDRTDDDVKNLSEKGIFALEVYAVESLYYCSDAIVAVADRQAESLDEDKGALFESANKEAIDVLKKHAERMAARRCERQVKETLSKIPNWESIMENPTQSIEISINSPFPNELNHFNKLVEEGNLDKLVARYPVRESCAFETIAKSLRCPNKKDYERMVITQIRRDNELAEKLKKHIGPLSEVLESKDNLQTT